MEFNENLTVDTVDVNAEAKAKLEAAGISAAMAAFIYDEKGNKSLNSEGMEVGDKITIVGMSDKPDSFTETTKDADGQTISRVVPYASVITTGDRDSISINRLVGTPKEKYFEAGRNAEHIDYNPEKVLKLPRRMADAAVAINGLKGKTFQLVEIADKCGRNFDRVYYRFVEVN